MMSIIKYAKREVMDRIQHLSPPALMILCDMCIWCEQKQLRFVISDAVSDLKEDTELNRTSKTHREGRAFDLSMRDWDRDTKLEFKRIFSAKYRHLAALDAQGNENLIVMHDAGTGDHAHVQVHSKYGLEVKSFS